MDQLKEQDDFQKAEIEIRRPFIGKFMKELNHMQNEKMKKAKRKNNKLNANGGRGSMKLDTNEKGFAFDLRKSSKKFVQVNRNGNRIIANWKNDQIHGEAQIFYNNGITFKGIYQNGMKIKGHFKFLNGYEYVGSCLGNKFYGEGSLIFPSGKVISGQWKEYVLVGNGKIQYPKGEVYYGELQNFKKHGYGHLFFLDGSKYVGYFANGMITGQGTYFIDDKPVSSGEWLNGQLMEEMDIDGEDGSPQKNMTIRTFSPKNTHFKHQKSQEKSQEKSKEQSPQKGINKPNVRNNKAQTHSQIPQKKVRFQQ